MNTNPFEPASRVLARPTMQFELHPPYRRPGRILVRPSHDTGIHQCVSVPLQSAPRPTRCRPSPCGRLSRPRSTTTAPPHPPLSVGIEPIHRSRTRPARSLERQTNGSHVHCCSVDGLGTRFYPCGLAMATPWTFTMASRAEHSKPSRELPTPRKPPEQRVRTAHQPASTGLELARYQEA